MKTLDKKQISLKVVTTIPENKDLQERVFYYSPEFDTAVHLCMCGCKSLTVTPGSMGFKFNVNDGKITLDGSVGNFQFPCRSHYVIRKGIAIFLG